MSDKTHAPTAQRLRRALGEGDLARSRLWVSAIATLLGMALLALALPVLSEAARELVDGAMRAARAGPARDAATHFFNRHLVPTLGVACAGTAALAAVAVLVPSLVQSRLGVAPARLKPAFARLSPAHGARQLFSWQRLAEPMLSILCALALWVVGTIFVVHALDAITAAYGMQQPTRRLRLATGGMLRLNAHVAAVLVPLALVDLALQRRLWQRRLRMSREEVRRESREAERSPEARRYQRDLQQEAR